MIKAIRIGTYRFPLRRSKTGSVTVYGLSGWKGSLPAFLVGLRPHEGGTLVMSDNSEVNLWDGDAMAQEAARAIWYTLTASEVDQGRAVARVDEACRWGDGASTHCDVIVAKFNL